MHCHKYKEIIDVVSKTTDGKFIIEDELPMKSPIELKG